MNYELIARMLESPGHYEQKFVDEQIEALRAADNATEARTVLREQQPAGDGGLHGKVTFSRMGVVTMHVDQTYFGKHMVGEGDDVVLLNITKNPGLTAAGRGGEGDWVLVPRVPDGRMEGALIAAMDRGELGNSSPLTVIRAAYKVLIAATPQQPPPVGVTGVIADFDRMIDNCNKLGSFNPTWPVYREQFVKWRTDLSHQQAAPSVSDGVAERCESGDPDCGPAVCEDDGGTLLCRKCYDGLETETRTQRKARERGMEIVPTPTAPEPAASGEGPETRFVDGMGWVVACRDAIKYVRHLGELIAADPDARHLLASGQGDVERLVVAGRAFFDGSNTWPQSAKLVQLHEALAPFAQQQDTPEQEGRS